MACRPDTRMEQKFTSHTKPNTVIGTLMQRKIFNPGFVRRIKIESDG